MTTYWCTWCGATATADDDAQDIPCVRCLHEFARLFGFIPKASMVPLAPGAAPGEAAASRRQFTFRDPDSGRLRGRTAVRVDDVAETG